MFSAFKRLTGGKTENGVPTTQKGHQAMSQNLQRKFARGVQYNMKIIIKGDRNTGKTCLFHRLQGREFIQEYVQTEEIQVASIQWNYKTTDDIVKVEVWDVVDKGKKRAPLEGLKLGEEIAPALDAEFLDVYKGTNGVILVMDITKGWTYEYVQKELEKIPAHVPVLVLGNHCDMAHHRTVTVDTVLFYIESVQRPPNKAPIRYSEASMSNGFGLKYLHKFFGLPFLHLQRETLLSQLERNANETLITLQELDLYQQSPDSDYDQFLDKLSKRRRDVADSVGSAMTHSTSVGPLPTGQGHQIPERSKSLNEIPRSQTTTSPSVIASKMFGVERPSIEGKSSVSLVNNLDLSVTSVEEFIPDEGVLDKSFLEEPHQNTSPGGKQQDPPESDSDENEGSNPLVAGFQDDLDPDDIPVASLRISSQSALSPEPSLDESSKSPEPKETITGPDLDQWLGGLTGRESPEGGEDSCNLDTVDSVVSPKPDKSSKTKKHKKKSSRDKDEEKEEKKKKKKSSSKKPKDLDEATNELEDFLNSHDTSYEAI